VRSAVQWQGGRARAPARAVAPGAKPAAAALEKADAEKPPTNAGAPNTAGGTAVAVEGAAGVLDTGCGSVPPLVRWGLLAAPGAAGAVLLPAGAAAVATAAATGDGTSGVQS
jgi:hypothetical protein